MIEIAPDEYQISCSYDEAVLYCFQLIIDGKIGWRLPTRDEYYDWEEIYGWYRDANLTYRKNDTQMQIIPVRDILNG